MGLVVTGAQLDGRDLALRCDGGLIDSIGPEVVPQPGDEVIDAEGMLLAPPFVNGHTHSAMTLFRGFGDDLPLMEWLQGKIWPAEAKLEPGDVYWGTRLAAIEMLRSGTTSFVDMYFHGDQAARAVVDSGLRTLLSVVFLDVLDTAKGDELRAGALEAVERLGEFGPLVRPSFGPHAVYTVSRKSLAWIAETAAERELPVQIHLSETEKEVADCIEANGSRPAAYLDELGLLTERTVLAHGIWLDDAELSLVAERGSTVVTNPAANMKLAVGGVFPYPRARRAGISIGLGTDGPSSNNNLDMLEEVKAFALIQKHDAGDTSVLPAADALAIARGQRSELLGGGELAEGANADFLLLNPELPELSAGDLDADLVYAATGSVVDTAVVAGRVLMRGREVEGSEEVLAEVRERAARLTS
ncbi:MAG: amidohydrolase [Solirubrobacterales bacterium]|nr:amidohydrolase [Solirubrobacterales bacterium]